MWRDLTQLRGQIERCRRGCDMTQYHDIEAFRCCPEHLLHIWRIRTPNRFITKRRNYLFILEQQLRIVLNDQHSPRPSGSAATLP